MPKQGLKRQMMTEELWIEVLSWRNDPLVYIWNKTNRPITLDEHIVWFRDRQLRLESEPIFSYHDGTSFVGMSRLDKVSEDTYEVSLITSPGNRGSGYGRQILTDICEYFLFKKSPESKLIAVVHQDNLRSQFLFKALGFRFLFTENKFRSFVFYRI